MKKSCCFMKIVSALFALTLLASCGSGGGGGGGSSGGGNSGSSGSTSISIRIPKTTSADTNLLGDFQLSDTDNFYYEIYYSKPNGSSESEHKFAGADKTVTFSNVKYDTYNFFLKIWVDSSKQTVLDTIQKEVAVSAQNNTVVFPDRSVSEYKNWFFVSTADDLRRTVTTISNDTTFSESNKAKICLRDTIAMVGYQTILASINGKYELLDNGFTLATQLYTVTLPSALPEGCSMATNSESNKFEQNQTVTLTVTAAEGWFFFPPTIDGVTITRSEEDPMQFTFDMPADDVEVTTTFFDAIYVSASGNSENDGLSEATAVDSLASAIRKINDIGNELSLGNFDWTIKVCGTIRGAQTVVYPMLYGTASVTIVGVNDGIIDGNEAGTALTINLTVPVTIKNLTIQNGKTSSNNGAGILITGAPVNLTLDSCVVKNNSVENGSGAGICVEYNSGRTAGTKLTLNNTEVSSNTITHNDVVVTYSGAGIMIENSEVELTLKGTSVIKDNIIDCSERSGGMDETPNGAGLFLGNRATTTIEESVSIENNSFRLTSGGVSYGGGIYISGGTLTVPVSVFTNNVAIYGNKIYISPQSSVVYNGESISIDRPVN